MHELGMCEGVLAAVERRAQGRPVARVGVQVGTQLGVAPEAFQQNFELVAAGGVAAEATTHLTMVGGEALLLEWIEYREPLPAETEA